MFDKSTDGLAKLDEWDLIRGYDLPFSPSDAATLLELNGRGYAEISKGKYAFTPFQLEQLRQIINREFDKLLAGHRYE